MIQDNGNIRSVPIEVKHADVFLRTQYDDQWDAAFEEWENNSVPAYSLAFRPDPGWWTREEDDRRREERRMEARARRAIEQLEME